jgi:hypothetical protein
MAAHLGGLAGGFLCGLVLSQPFTVEARAGRMIRNFGVLVLGSILVGGGIIGIPLVHPDLEPQGDKVENGNVEVFYTGGVTKDEAERLAAYLAKSWGPSPGRRSVQLRKTDNGYQFRMVVKSEFQNDEKMLKALEVEGAQISHSVLNGAPVEVHVCDDHLKTIRVLPPRADIRYSVAEGKVEVFYGADVDSATAKRLAQSLVTIFRDNPSKQVSFKLAQRGNTNELYMVVDPEVLKKPEVIAGLSELKKHITNTVFKGSPVELYLCDDSLNVIRRLD